MSYQFDVDKAKNAGSSGFPFWNPSNDFEGVVACLSEIRHIEKKGKMKGDADIVDVTVYGKETARFKTESGEKKEEPREYKGNNFSMVINQKKVLNSKIPKFVPLTGKKLVIIGLGTPTGKQYFDYYINTEEKAKQEGVLK